MTEPVDEAPWSDPSWSEPVDRDNPLRAQLRRHQGWWRQKDAARGLAGSLNKSRTNPVVSMLGTLNGFSPNLMTEEAIASAVATIARMKSSPGPGLIQVDRLERNLLSSQPLCFNLFGHLSATPTALLPWVQSIDDAATQVDLIQLEIAPTSEPLGGSAFDAFVEYRSNGKRRFLGIECKYAESLATAKPKNVEKYVAETVPPLWKEGAATPSEKPTASPLDTPKLRQFWFNTLLVHRVLGALADGKYDRGLSVVVAMEQDAPAREACAAVSGWLEKGEPLRFSPIQDVVRLVAGHDAWKNDFQERYLDLDKSESPSHPAAVAR